LKKESTFQFCCLFLGVSVNTYAKNYPSLVAMFGLNFFPLITKNS